jgi:hypothetical protein
VKAFPAQPGAKNPGADGLERLIDHLSGWRTQAAIENRHDYKREKPQAVFGMQVVIALCEKS